MRSYCAVLALVLIVAAAPGAPQDTPHQTPLLDCMESMKVELKGIAMSLQGKDEVKALEHIAAMQSLVLLAKLELPPNLDQIPEEGRAAHRVGFRKELIAVLKELAVMEEHVLDGDLEAAFKSVIDPLYPLRERAHEAYQRKE